MYDEGHLTDGVMIEWLKSHTNVVYQPPVGHRAYSGINPYALGFAMYTDLKRICEEPTDEDRAWFPDIAGTRLAARRSTTRCATSRTRASSASTCRPKLMRDFRLFSILDDENESELEVSAIHDDSGYRRVREALSRQYDLGSPRAQHPGLERQPARRPLADAAPHPAQRPAAARRRAGGAEARRAAVGLRRAPRKRRRRTAT